MNDEENIYIHTQWNITKKKEILPFMTTRMGLEGSMLSEISQIEQDITVWSHLHVESLKKKKRKKQRGTQIPRIDWWLAEVGGRGVGETSEGGQKAQTSSFQIDKSWACNVQHSDYS